MTDEEKIESLEKQVAAQAATIRGLESQLLAEQAPRAEALARVESYDRQLRSALRLSAIEDVGEALKELCRQLKAGRTKTAEQIQEGLETSDQAIAGAHGKARKIRAMAGQ